LQGDLTSSAQPGFEGFFEQVAVFLYYLAELICLPLTTSEVVNN